MPPEDDTGSLDARHRSRSPPRRVARPPPPEWNCVIVGLAVAERHWQYRRLVSWSNVGLPGGWRLNRASVPMLPERVELLQSRRLLLPTEQRKEPDVARSVGGGRMACRSAVGAAASKPEVPENNEDDYVLPPDPKVEYIFL